MLHKAGEGRDSLIEAPWSRGSDEPMYLIYEVSLTAANPLRFRTRRMQLVKRVLNQSTDRYTINLKCAPPSAVILNNVFDLCFKLAAFIELMDLQRLIAEIHAGKEFQRLYVRHPRALLGREVNANEFYKNGFAAQKSLLPIGNFVVRFLDHHT